MKKRKRTELWWVVMLPCFAFSLFVTSCKDSTEIEKVPYKPDQPVVLDHFAPDSGRVATQMLIYGSNFGSDKSKINVIINDKNAAVIGVNPEGTIVYVIVPSLLKEGDPHNGGDMISTKIKVSVGEGNEVQEKTFSKEFTYKFSQNVSTFLGFTDQDGNSAVIDGSFTKAQFNTPSWLAFDEKTPEGTARNFYLIEESTGEGNWSNGSVRFIDMQNKQVSTLFRAGNGVNRPRTIAFTLKKQNGQMVANSIGDTMIIANDDGNWNSIGTIILVRDSITHRFPQNYWQPVMHHKQCNGGAIHPISGEYWFNSYEKSQVYKVFDRSGSIWRYGGPDASHLNTDGQEGTNYYFLVQDNGWEFSIQIAPSGNFAYLVVRNQHYIARMEYNYDKKAFEKPQPFVGTKQKSGFQDGVGVGNTLFNTPQQGAFDKDDNFYVCDAENNCIRKVTPQGQVSTFAGRPGNPGYSDGALRDAQFDAPLGIIYDDINQIFYVGDRDNHRIRAIKVE
jgi:hypothetical protein